MLSQEQFNRAIEAIMSGDQWKEVVDGVRENAGNAFGFNRQPQPAEGWGDGRNGPGDSAPPPRKNPWDSWTDTMGRGLRQAGQWGQDYVDANMNLPGAARDAAGRAIDWLGELNQPWAERGQGLYRDLTAPAKEPTSSAWGYDEAAPASFASQGTGGASARESSSENQVGDAAAIKRLQGELFGAAEPTEMPPPGSKVPPFGDTPTEVPDWQSVTAPTTWEQQFFAEHGRAPTSYDALVRSAMEQRMPPGQTPTYADWQALTRDLNAGRVTGESVYGPRDVPEFMPGFGRRANEAKAPSSLTPKVITAQPNEGALLSAQAINAYLVEEFRNKQRKPSPLEGQGQSIVDAARKNGIDTTLLLATLESLAAKGRRMPSSTQDLNDLAADVKGWTPTAEVKQIQQAINQYYGPNATQKAAPQQEAGVAKPQTGTAASEQELARYTTQPNGIGQPPSIEQAGIENYITREFRNSPLAGKSKAVYDAGVKYGVDPVLLLAIIEQENAAGTAPNSVAVNGNNYGSMVYSDPSQATRFGAYPDQWETGSDGGRFLKFPSPEAGITGLAMLLGKTDRYKELTTWGQLNNVFSDTSRGDSPVWAEQVGRIADNIRRYYGRGN